MVARHSLPRGIAVLPLPEARISVACANKMHALLSHLRARDPDVSPKCY
jgi:hypothetical protein